VRTLVEYLINSLDDDGYLKLEIDSKGEDQALSSSGGEESQIREIQDIIANLKSEYQASKNVREAFNVLRSLEPPGIGAKNLQECLLIQIRRSASVSHLAKRIIEEEFPLFEKLKISAISKKLEVTPEEVQEALKEIGTLEPKPGRVFIFRLLLEA